MYKLYYARPRGYIYHSSRDCIMLADGNFERLKYRNVTRRYIFFRNLSECVFCFNKRTHKGRFNNEE